jgi:hypothetical protein
MPNEPPSGGNAPASADVPGAKVDGETHDDRIRKRAHIIWIDEGRPDGRDVDHWLRAKWEYESGPTPKGEA